MKEIISTIFYMIFTICFAPAQDTIHLGADSDLPFITIYQDHGNKGIGSAVIVCPGGAYAFRSSGGTEGVETCKKLAEKGVTAFLLDYRLPKGIDSIPLSDALLAITYIRNHSKTLGIHPHRVGILGYSAGGHLASSAGTHWTSATNRPDFVVVNYAVISMADSITHQWTQSELLGKSPSREKVAYYSNELQVTDSTPGTFISHAMDDAGVPVANSLYFYAALLQHKVPTEFFLYAKGGHAYGHNNPAVTVQWFERCIKWIKEDKWKHN